MSQITLPVFNIEGKEVDHINLDSAVFDGIINSDLLYDIINAYRANKRQGLAATKTRGEVSGGGKKPWKQKGTGRARHGSTRSPLWRHGGVVFGPHPRDYTIRLSKTIRDVALKSSLNAKVKEENLIVLDAIKLQDVKTKEAAKIFSNLKIKNKNSKLSKTLLLTDKHNQDLYRAFRNIGSLNLNVASGTNAYEVLAAKKIVITKDALGVLVTRLKK